MGRDIMLPTLDRSMEWGVFAESVVNPDPL
jgi:hypothetical protein